MAGHKKAVKKKKKPLIFHQSTFKAQVTIFQFGTRATDWGKSYIRQRSTNYDCSYSLKILAHVLAKFIAINTQRKTLELWGEGEVREFTRFS